MFLRFDFISSTASDHDGYSGLQAQISDDELINEAMREYSAAGGADEPMRELEAHGELYDDFTDELSEQDFVYGDAA